MIVLDASGNEFHFEDEWEQDFEVQLPWLLPWGNSRMYWRSESSKKRKQKHLTMVQLQSLGIAPNLPCTIVLQRVKHRGSLDDDNVPDCMKYVRDTVARWMGLKNDKAPGLKFLYGQLGTIRKGFLAVRVTIYDRLLTQVP